MSKRHVRDFPVFIINTSLYYCNDAKCYNGLDFN